MSSGTARSSSAAIRTATPSSVRAVNRAILLELIRRRQPVSRADLARITGIVRSSVSEIVDELVASGLVTEERANPYKRGRVPMSLALNENGYRVLGLDIRPRHCRIACAGLGGRIVKTWTFATPTSPRELVRRFAGAVDRITRDPEYARTGFRRIGISIPGHVDAPSGRILWTPTHEELADFPITSEINARTGIPAAADNDCNVGALSELWLATERNKIRSADFVFLNVSDFGTGAGAVLNGTIYLGHNAHFAAEFGHMVVEPDGVPCRCGRRGCWERYVSNFATWDRYNSRDPFTTERFEALLEAARNGNKRALTAILKTARYLSLGISNIGFALNPAEVVVAGRLTSVWDLIRPEIEGAYGAPQLRYSIRPARLSADDSLLHGAVCLALRSAFAPPSFGEA